MTCVDHAYLCIRVLALYGLDCTPGPQTDRLISFCHIRQPLRAQLQMPVACTLWIRTTEHARLRHLHLRMDGRMLLTSAEYVTLSEHLYSSRASKAASHRSQPQSAMFTGHLAGNVRLRYTLRLSALKRSKVNNVMSIHPVVS